MITPERREELLAMRRMKESNVHALRRRAAFRVLRGGRLGVPRALDGAQLVQRPRPKLTLVLPPLEVSLRATRRV
jgi:hypothetical protein